MSQKVLLILVDGMRPDAIDLCGHSFLKDLRKESSYSMHATTTMPSVTLPCHASLFFSVNPDRHGITTNVWMPPVRPIDSLGDAVHLAGKRAAMYYNWEQLRDLNRPGSLVHSEYHNMWKDGGIASDHLLTDHTLDCIRNDDPDFIFLYLGYTDEAGHANGWLTEPYMEAVANASACIEKLYRSLPEGWSMIITADHGGHERSHGHDIPEDMTIPVYFAGKPFEKGKELQDVNIKDIAPTIAKIMEFAPPREWEGRSIL
ncbi:MAG: alkaline phosphatase family protein [Candidatus Merdivicinus sp.]